MRLTGIRLAGVLAFRDEVRLDLGAIPGTLVAVVGENGAGKSTLLEAPIAALYRTLLSRPGSLYESVNGEAYLEASFLDQAGRTVTARIQVDGPRRKTEQHLLVDGVPVTTGRKGEVEAAVVERFGSLALVTAGPVASQNRQGDLVRLSKAERRALFAELLELGHYAELAAAAKARREAVTVQAEAARLAAAGLDGLQAALRGVVAELEGRREEQHARAGEARAARVTHQQAGEVYAHEQARAERAQAAHERRRMAADALRRAQAGLESAQGRQRAAQERANGLAPAQRAELVRLEERQQRVQQQLAEVTEEALAPLRERVDAAQGERDAARVDGERLAAQNKGASAALEALRQAKGRVEQAHAALESERRGLREQAGLLGRVPCAGKPWKPVQPMLSPDEFEGVDLEGACPLLAAARDARERLPTLAVGAGLLEGLEDAQAALDLWPALEDLEAQTGAARDRWSRANEALVTAQADLAAARKARAEHTRELERVQGEVVDAQKRHVADEAIARRELASSGEDVAAWQVDVDRAAAEDTQASAGVEGLVVPDLEPLREAVEAAARAEMEANSQLQRVERDVARLEGRQAELERTVAQQQAQAAQAQLLAADVGDWQVLEQALGRDGLQALEVDAAGPAVSELANELLRSCWGPRFSVRFETQRALKSKAGFEEVFEIRVFDADRGAERTVEQLSGGEQVIVSEALALAVSIYNARRHGISWRTLIRDETAGALSPANAQAYLAMLRHAAALGGFDQVLFVAHQPELWERADARVLVGGGRVEVA